LVYAEIIRNFALVQRNEGLFNSPSFFILKRL